MRYSYSSFLILLFQLESTSFQPTNAFTISKPTLLNKHSFRTPIYLKETKDTLQNEVFVNDGMLSGLQSFLKLFGFEEGKQMILAVPTPKKEGEAPLVSEDIAMERRKQAAIDLINIGPEERERRDKAGTICLYTSAIYAFLTAVILDQGDINGHIVRFTIILPFFFGYAFKQSAKFGLWNIAQAGLWDVDGNGLSTIEDPKLAQALLKKVNDFNVSTALQVLALVLLFSVPSQHLVSNIVILSSIFTGLYYINGKVPEP